MAAGSKRRPKAPPRARRTALAPRQAAVRRKSDGADLRHQLAEARAQQAATAEILKAMASSPTDLQPVLDAIAESAARVCGAEDVLIWRVYDSTARIVAKFGPFASEPIGHERTLERGRVSDRAVIERETVHVHDLAVARAEFPGAAAGGLKWGVRTALATPLMREGVSIGAIHCRRMEVRPFTAKQIDLLKTFADQAVIAIENVRLFNETKEALERQTATAEILKAISSSPTDVQPVFDAIVASSMRLLKGATAHVTRLEGGSLHLAAYSRTDAAGAAALNQLYPLAVAGTVAAEVLAKRSPLIVADVESDPRLGDEIRKASRARGVRSFILVPLVSKAASIGTLVVNRRDAGAFSEHEIDLLRTFADQAVIAIENVRLFNETKEALERQTASSEVLRIVAGSMADAQPVFEAILASALRLFEGFDATVWLVREGKLVSVVRGGATLDPKLKVTAPITTDDPYGAVVLHRKALRLDDIAADPEISEAARAALLARRRGSVVMVPLIRDGEAIGALSVSRTTPYAFKDAQVALLANFADQAVIAIENVRLFNELEVRNRDVTEALEQQRATADVLASISGSMTDTQPVFDAIVRNINRLFGTRFAVLQLLRDGRVEMPAVDGAPGFERLRERYPRPLDDTTVGGLAMLRQQTVRYAPVIGNPATPPATVQFAKDFGFDSVIFTPMIREGKVIGAIGTALPEPKPFDERQVALIKTFADQAVIAIENARLFNETKEALERQTAIGEILRVISNSPADVQPVLDAVAERAARICDARVVDIVLRDGDAQRVAATFGDLGRPLGMAVPLNRDTVMGRSIVDGRPVQVADLQAAEDEFALGRELAIKYGHRSILAVPLMREGRALGTILVRRAEVRPFDEKHVTLLQTFADQAAIAIENVRLFNETKEALERQTATAGILAAMSGSMTDAKPVFEAIVRSCGSLFPGSGVALRLLKEGVLQVEANVGMDAGPVPVDRGSAVGACVLDARTVHLPDLEAAVAEFPRVRQLGLKYGFHSGIYAPLLREGVAIGTIAVLRPEAGGFRDKDVALFNTFADQAVIAIENVRLFNETKEALERQTATAEILKVISSSPTDVQPVFEAIAQSASALFRCDVAILILEGEHIFLRTAAGSRATPERRQKMHKLYPIPYDVDKNMASRVIAERRTVEVRDTEAPDNPPLTALAGRAGQFRSLTMAPLQREGVGIGVISLLREEPGFRLDEKQLSLLKTFADQAVIAIENVRLFNETKEALEHQTATSEVLQVISSSVADTAPVFEKILRSCQRLFDNSVVTLGLLGDDSLVHVHQDVDVFNHPNEATRTAAAWVRDQHPRAARDSIYGYAIHKRHILHFRDVQNGAGVPQGLRESTEFAGNFSALYAPLLWEGKGIGALNVSRFPPVEFSEKEIALLKTFADQAVIAIQNARLFNETKEALERQTATAEILRVIASSPSDVQPVFDAIAASARRLLDGGAALVARRDGDLLHLAAYTPTNAAADAALQRLFPSPITGKGHLGRAVLSASPVLVDDIQNDASYSEAFRESARTRGLRSVVSVPMMREGEAIGVISVNRSVAGRFSEHQTNLLKTFADQAVIAIENVRLFNETKEALERQTATSEVLRVIGSSVTDIQPVFDIIAERAARLTGAEYGWVFRFDGEQIHVASAVGVNAEGMEAARRAFPMRPSGGSITARAIRDGKVVNVADVLAEDDAEYKTKEIAKRAGYRATLSVPMIRDRQIVGAVTASRGAVGKFSDKEVDLLGTFADQAVIAIENVRLFNETREALEQQTATAEILKVISESPTDTQPVFDAIVHAGLQLFPGAMVAVAIPEGAKVRAAAIATDDPAVTEAWRKRFPFPLGRDHMHGLAILDCRMVDVPDAATELNGPMGRGAKNFLASGNRAMTVMPMVCGDSAIGAISVVRQKAGALSEKQLALLRTFAAQAVIAIENVRVFKELEARTGALTRSVEQLTALGEVGQAISSTLDLETVLKTIVQRAVQITGLDGGSIYEYDEKSEEFHLRAAQNLSEAVVQVLRETPAHRSEGVIGRAVETGEPVEIAEMLDDNYQSPRRDTLIEAGYRALLVVPLRRDEHIIGALAVNRKAPGNFSHDVVELLKTFATQSAMAIQNARLFREIAEKGRQLEEASRHKSNFLASMSHELRTPLNAILGFNEMILGQVYGEVPTDMREPLADIQTSGKHLLRLINNVLDLAKIEAGRMELSLQDYSVHDTVGSVHSTLRPLASEKGLEFLVNVPEDVPLAYGDSGRITQCLMNLAGNSIKFTKAGRVEIAVEEKDGLLTYRVLDTGIGIPPDKIASLFTEFKQTDATIASEYGGTGLGLSISRKFVEMHGGRIWIESELGKGSVFIIEVPLRVNAP